MVAYANSYDVFPKPVEIKGGVCYFLENNSYQGNCDYTFINGGEIITDNLNLGALDVFIRIPRVSKIVQKVHSKGEESLSQIISSDTPFGFPSNVKKSKKRPFDVSEKKDREFNTAIYLNIIFSACDKSLMFLLIPKLPSNGANEFCVTSNP